MLLGEASLLSRQTRVIAFASLLCGIGPSCYAGTAEGYAAYLRGDYQTAMRQFRPLADHGDPAAQVAVGWLYDNGLGTPHNDGLAAHWYTLAAEQGCAMPQQYLGLMYAKGEGVPKDFSKAEKWFRLAADQGDAGGQYGLGVIYRDGDGVPRDLVEAYKWFALAAKDDVEGVQGQQALAARAALTPLMTREQIAKAEGLVKAGRPSPAADKTKAQRCSFGATK